MDTITLPTWDDLTDAERDQRAQRALAAIIKGQAAVWCLPDGQQGGRIVGLPGLRRLGGIGMAEGLYVPGLPVAEVAVVLSWLDAFDDGAWLPAEALA